MVPSNFEIIMVLFNLHFFTIAIAIVDFSILLYVHCTIITLDRSCFSFCISSLLLFFLLFEISILEAIILLLFAIALRARESDNYCCCNCWNCKHYIWKQFRKETMIQGLLKNLNKKAKIHRFCPCKVENAITFLGAIEKSSILAKMLMVFLMIKQCRLRFVIS